MQYLFEHWKSIEKRLQGARLFVFLDYDGTLAQIVHVPEKARITGSARQLLAAIIKKPGCRVAVISGRALKDVKKRVGLNGVIYAGNHGLELEGPRIKFRKFLSQGYTHALQKLRGELARKLKLFKGVIIEDKGLSLSVHYRRVDKKAIPQVKTIFHETVITSFVADTIRVKQGKMVFEIRPPVEWDKGRVVLWLLARQKFSAGEKRVYPVYIGDDATDEDAFRALKDIGLTVLVGGPALSSQAHYYVRNTQEVYKLLKLILSV
ncbi:MAG: trehalose-phosphatase [Candidatus Omnitrophica bacterium]|nr:trehalose-phosphatase [Candidatus Omnitrophota bacterium]